MSIEILQFAAQDPSQPVTVVSSTAATATTGFKLGYRIVDLQAPGNRTAVSPLTPGYHTGDIEVTCPTYGDDGGNVGYELVGNMGGTWMAIGSPSASPSISASTDSWTATTPEANWVGGLFLPELGQIDISAHGAYPFYVRLTKNIKGLWLLSHQLEADLVDIAGHLSVSVVGYLPSGPGGGVLNTSLNASCLYLNPWVGDNYLPVAAEADSTLKLQIELTSNGREFGYLGNFPLELVTSGFTKPAAGTINLPSPSIKYRAEVAMPSLYPFFTLAGGRLTLKRDLFINGFDQVFGLLEGYSFPAQGYTSGATGYRIALNSFGELLVKLPGEVLGGVNPEIVLVDSTGYKVPAYSGVLSMGYAEEPIDLGQLTYWSTNGGLTVTPTATPAGVALNGSEMGETRVCILRRGVCTSTATSSISGILSIICGTGQAGTNWVQVTA
jgi:hypothetical protein